MENSPTRSRVAFLGTGALGGLFARAGAAAERFVRRFMPDPFALVLLLTLVALGLGLLTMVLGMHGAKVPLTETIFAPYDLIACAVLLLFVPPLLHVPRVD